MERILMVTGAPEELSDRQVAFVKLLCTAISDGSAEIIGSAETIQVAERVLGKILPDIICVICPIVIDDKTADEIERFAQDHPEKKVIAVNKSMPKGRVMWLKEHWAIPLLLDI